ncbi:VOC family protein [Halomonas elongata]|uniref:VOC family protein n=1 Tax=Halomonas elongata TaxID=2746 RepID=UPI0038D4E999
MHLLINIDVPELGPAVDFYRDALGFTLNRFLDDDVAELTGASSRLYLLKNEAGTSSSTPGSAPRHYTRHWTPIHFDVVVDDLEAAARRAEHAGALRESECREWLESRCMTFSDPFGHGFCLIEFTNDTYA